MILCNLWIWRDNEKEVWRDNPEKRQTEKADGWGNIKEDEHV